MIITNKSLKRTSQGLFTQEQRSSSSIQQRSSSPSIQQRSSSPSIQQRSSSSSSSIQQRPSSSSIQQWSSSIQNVIFLIYLNTQMLIALKHLTNFLKN
jgi:hypothetical protein